jgi:lipoprotein-anchoring transpeptidase ErfK/SrfK
MALCLVGAWLSGGCNIDQLIDPDGNLRETTTYRAAYEDTLLDVARRFHLGYVEMVAANPGTDPWLPGEGTSVVLPTIHLLPDAKPEGVVINLADMRLYYFDGAAARPRT